MKDIVIPSNSEMNRKSFLFGTATSSFQIEGDIAGREPCIWDTFCEKEGAIADKSDGVRACEHIERWKDDVALLQDLNVDAYRFSISWPRVVSASGELREEGLSFYIQLLDSLNDAGIKPFVTLYHWDLPQYLEDKGGWVNRDTVFAFEHYVDVITKALGDRVYSYATFNEPFCSAFLGYEIGVHAPGKVGRKLGRAAAHHILLAHGKGMKVLRKNAPKALSGIVLNFTPCYASSDKREDLEATKNADEYINQWYMQPVMEGAYPEVIDLVDDNDKPPIEPGDMQEICQPIDFLGINFYTRLHYSAAKDQSKLYFEHEHNQPKTDIGWEIYPQALYDLLTSLHSRYQLPPIYITENGAAMADEMVDGEVNDMDRIEYFSGHMTSVSKAIDHGVKVSGYFAWSLMDNFEWAEGYLKRFGIVHVDFETQKRTLKASAKAFKKLLVSRY
ncbi:GH1 family beta-glucosidase [Alteromonas sp. KUL49]|uniref:GH1 family beta-glucosidase n=1 Tax=Alteromonas sp. KUL49 TaxID=2480798 RepID=UPI00102F04F9|nr:GH1 family beta-glucosidase [Alteromonas sp. KUL49]TAP42109.1 beta-glucosidase [Alteromonas sp. KUL49]GEA09691.1 beta-glucosidase [Alteromonas sp. KUL49]